MINNDQWMMVMWTIDELPLDVLVVVVGQPGDTDCFYFNPGPPPYILPNGIEVKNPSKVYTLTRPDTTGDLREFGMPYGYYDAWGGSELVGYLRDGGQRGLSKDEERWFLATTRRQ